MGETNTDEQVEYEVGEVKWFDSKLGYGFIVPNNGGKEVFVHQSDIAVHGYRTLSGGNHVEYEVWVSDDGRLRARRVVILSTLDD